MVYTGLIAPIPHLTDFDHNQFYLILNHLLEDTTYRRFFRQQADSKAYIILDNSAHEYGSGGQIEDLLDSALQIGAREIVLPDTLFESKATVDRSVSAMSVLQNELNLLDSKSIQLAVVPQGESPKAYKSCTEQLVHMMNHYFPYRRFTIGISKDYSYFHGGLLKIIRHTIWPLVNRYPQTPFDLHLLGWGKELWELNTTIKKSVLPIRSTDSAKPFTFALNNVWLEYGIEAPYSPRPKNYFDTELTSDQILIAQHNVEIFQKCAQGEYK